MPIPARFRILPLVAVLFVSGGAAHATSLKVDYALSLAGLPLGRASLAGEFNGDRYSLNASGQMTGLAGLFSGGSRGAATSTGSFAADTMASGAFSASGHSSSVTRTLQFGVERGNVGPVVIEPPFELRPDRVPLTEENKRGVVDPLSALVGVVPKGRTPLDPANCRRTLPIFEGTQRFDVVLDFAETRQVKLPAYSGDVLVCRARYIPIAGHREARPAVQFMRDTRDISVWLVPVPGTRALAPLRISVATLLGTSVFEATSWKVN